MTTKKSIENSVESRKKTDERLINHIKERILEYANDGYYSYTFYNRRVPDNVRQYFYENGYKVKKESKIRKFLGKHKFTISW